MKFFLIKFSSDFQHNFRFLGSVALQIKFCVLKFCALVRIVSHVCFFDGKLGKWGNTVILAIHQDEHKATASL